jgi:8-oxo-dGTP pyrophosphatase MutT (NUDIX family)
MWLFTTVGFFSVVQKPGMTDLTIRTRVREDLDRLRAEYLPELGPTQTTPGNDYPYRALAGHDSLAAALGRLVTDLHYGNFKDAVALKQGSPRSSAYHDVWSAVRKGLKPLDAAASLPSSGTGHASGRRLAYGGVVLSPDGRVLLREPRGHYGGYVWTFPKGGPEPGESPEQAAQREVLEETGVSATIVRRIPGLFAGDTSDTAFFLMSGSPGQERTSDETQAVRWALPDEARRLIGETRSLAGKRRDLDVLEAALALEKRQS